MMAQWLQGRIVGGFESGLFPARLRRGAPARLVGGAPDRVADDGVRGRKAGRAVDCSRGACGRHGAPIDAQISAALAVGLTPTVA